LHHHLSLKTMKKLFLLLPVMFLFIVTASAQLISQIKLDSTLQNGYQRLAYGNMTIAGHLSEGKKQGSWAIFFPTGQVHILEHYLDNLKNGLYVQIGRNGNIQEQSYFRHDTLHGQLLKFAAGGRLTLEENYFMGKLDSLRKVYYERGAIQEESYYKHGQRNGTSIWYDESGNVIAEYQYLNGFFEGVQKSYYPGGQLKSEQGFILNRQHGPAREYHSNGQLKTMGDFVEGHKHGKWVEFDETGKPVKTTTYKKGVEK